MRKGIIAGFLLALFSVVIGIFWYVEWQYALPTPIPSNYKAINLGTKIDLINSANSKPKFFHFFNPDCPCSRFNMKHFKELVSEYGNLVDFKVVLMTNKSYTEKQIQEKYDLSIPVIHDENLAQKCGVYSTPQAVIINNDNKIFYRGNYNKTRYCTDKRFNFAQQALDQLIKNKPLTLTSQIALKAYGCQLPNCSKF